MLSDRLLDFSETREKEWEQLKTQVGDGIELMLPDSERWFFASVEGENIKVESAKRNVRPLMVYNPPMIKFEEFVRVTEQYNQLFTPSAEMLESKLDLQKSMPNFRYIFVLIYNLI